MKLDETNCIVVNMKIAVVQESRSLLDEKLNVRRSQHTWHNKTIKDNLKLINYIMCNSNNNNTSNNINNNNNSKNINKCINNSTHYKIKKIKYRDTLSDTKQIVDNSVISLNLWQMKKPFRWRMKICQRKHIYLLLALILLLYIMSAILNYFDEDAFEIENDETEFRLQNLHSHVPGMKDYLVWSEHCKMPNVDPYLPEIMKHFRREKYKTCQKLPPLTRIVFDETTKHYMLRIDEQYAELYTKMKSLNCCYQSIERNCTGANIDTEVSLSECLKFFDRTRLPSTIDSILVRCYSNNKQIYINGHPMMPERDEIQKRLNFWSKYDRKFNRRRPPNVLMLGIDSVSRLNLIRAMPKTAKYLYDNEWFELSGYNKIDDNTFPNLMAILTGLNKTEALKRCKPTILGGLDNCDFIWHMFRRYGYVTAYAEDEASINTFNYLKAGFIQSPTDYYLRPFLLSAEKQLKIKYKSNLIYCLGYQQSADYVYEYALELAKRYRNDTYFGLFWTNTFSHNSISDCTSMDIQMVKYLKRFAQLGVLDDTIIIFFSDHGMRYGPTRTTYSGHLEERLPFMFIWLPNQLKHKYPNFVNALNMNKNRLTNPYDVHMTLKHILNLTGRLNLSESISQTSSVPLACPKCHSLLKPVSYNRSCEDVAIEAHWCTCLHYQSIRKNSKTVITLGHLLINFINDYVANFQNKTFSKLCTPLKLNHVESAYLSQPQTNFNFSFNASSTSIHNYDIYRISFYTKPNNALFEATVQYNVDTGYMKVTGEISRLNSYIRDSECVSDGGAKKYCSCYNKRIF